MTTETGPFRLPRPVGDTKKLLASGEHIRVLKCDDAQVYATYCGECSFVWKAPVGNWQMAFRLASEHRNLHRIWNGAEVSNPWSR